MLARFFFFLHYDSKVFNIPVIKSTVDETFKNISEIHIPSGLKNKNPECIRVFYCGGGAAEPFLGQVPNPRPSGIPSGKNPQSVDITHNGF